jgi:hypothetical protein
LVLLFNAGGNADLLDGDGSTPLHKAAIGGHYGCVLELLDRHASYCLIHASVHLILFRAEERILIPQIMKDVQVQ